MCFACTTKYKTWVDNHVSFTERLMFAHLPRGLREDEFERTCKLEFYSDVGNFNLKLGNLTRYNALHFTFVGTETKTKSSSQTFE